MNSPLPKYLQISQIIEEQIRSGEWDNRKMPSVRGIAATHNVSVVTASRALQVLRDKGLINAVERSGCYLIPQPPAAVEHWALFLRITPGEWYRETVSITLRGFDLLAEREGVRFADKVFQIGDEAVDGVEERLRKQAEAAREAGVTGVFFLPSRLSEATLRQDQLFLQTCRPAGLPVVLIERNLRGPLRPLEHDLVACDDLDGGRRSTRHLLELGRQRIAFVAGSPTSSHEDRLAGYLHSLYQARAEQGAAVPPLVLWQDPALPSKEAYRRLTDELLRQKVDAVICYQDYTAIGLILELLPRGVRVPDDVAIVGFEDLPIGNMFRIGVTTYQLPSEGIACEALRRMRERLAHPDAPPVKVVVPGRLILRESTLGV